MTKSDEPTIGTFKSLNYGKVFSILSDILYTSVTESVSDLLYTCSYVRSTCFYHQRIMNPSSRIYQFNSPLARSHAKRVSIAEKQRVEYLNEINEMIHETDYLVSFAKNPSTPLPACLSSPRPSEKIKVQPPTTPEEREELLFKKPKSLVPKRPLKPIHYTKRTQSALFCTPSKTSKSQITNSSLGENELQETQERVEELADN